MTSANFLGIPISGDISKSSGRAVQEPREVLEQAIQAVLDDPLIDYFGWRQYTPYFNDGEPCEFSTHGLWIKTVKDTPEKLREWGAANGYDDEDWDTPPEDDNYYLRDLLEVDYSTHPTLGGREYPNGYKAEAVVVSDYPESYARARELNRCINGGAHYDTLYDLFGDHCQVVVRRTGITVDEYSHD